MSAYALVICVATLAASPSEELARLEGRILSTMLPSSSAATSAARTAMEKIAPDGAWPDVDYADQERTYWRAQDHLARLRDMATAYTAPGSALAQDPRLREAIVKALDFWLVRDFQNPNWWHNQIGAPGALGQILLAFKGDLTPAQREKGAAIMKRADWSKWTGENLVWGVTIQVLRGCLEEAPEVVRQAYDRMYEEIRVMPPGQECIQADMSFHQHGAQLYSGGYGLSFTGDVAAFIWAAEATAFAPPPAVRETFIAYVLDGQQWMMRGKTFDYSAVGREIVRPGKNGAVVEQAARRLAELASARQAELAVLAARIRGDGEPTWPGGNRHFWRSDYMTHQRPSYFISIRMASQRTLRGELCNNEGKRSHHLADGATLIYRTGHEYTDIFPAWDWQRLPGVTCLQTSWEEKGKVGGQGESDFVGGVSDVACGLAAMDFVRGPLRARKAWLCFEEGVLALASGIACADGRAVLTSINQCHGAPPARVSDQAEPLASGARVIEGPAWIAHDGIGYAVLDPGGTIHVQCAAQSGAWSDMGVAQRAPVSCEVFSLWLDHGGAPDQRTYAYAVCPALSEEALAAWIVDPNAYPVRVLANTAAIQAACDTRANLLAAAFWQPGAIAPPDGPTLAVDQPCLLLWRGDKEGVRIAIANPLNATLRVNIKTSAKLAGEGAEPVAGGGTRIAFDLPDGAEAGRSLVKSFTAP